jgi:transposase InsO family protein
MGFITDLPPSNNYDYIPVIFNHFTKYVIFIPVTKTLDTVSLSNVFIRDYFKRFALPKFIVSNRDKLFTSNYWKQFTSSLKIKLNLTTAYRPQSNGQVERTNQILECYLRNYCKYKQDNWYV